METRGEDKEKEKPEMVFLGEKEVLWEFKESCYMKSGGETRKQNYLCFGLVVDFADVPQQHLDLWRCFHFSAAELWVEQLLASFSFPLLIQGIVAVLVFLFRNN